MTRKAAGVRALGLIVHPRRDILGSADTVRTWAGARDVRVLALAEDGARYADLPVELVDPEGFGEADVVVALGGDGTMLGALRRTAGTGVPVLGVNHGHLGFLVEVDPGHLPEALDRLESRAYTLENHDAVRATLGEQALLAFNDLVLARPTLTGSARLRVSVQDAPYGYYRADAVVVATATGSTAYNYAAGGPLLSPSAGALVITPVAPMSGLSRSVVIGRGDRLTLSVDAGDRPVALLADGIEVGMLGPGEELPIAIARKAAQVVRLDATGYARRSQIKLSLLDLPITAEEARALITQRTGRPVDF